jgi:hypothetical protein
MRPFSLDLDLASVDPDGLADGNSSAITQIVLDGALTSGEDADGIAASNTSAGTSVVLDGVLTSGGLYQDATSNPRHITLLDAGGDNQATATYTIAGTDVDGNTLTENITGPGSTLFVHSVNRYATVTAITISSPVAGSTISIGVNGVFTSSDGLGRRLSILGSAHDQSAKTYTITGTDADGLAESEDLTGPGSGATVTTLKYFLTVTNIVVSAGTASSTVDIGTVDEAVSKTFPLNYRANNPANYQSNVTGTASFAVDQTMSDIHALANPSNDAIWFKVAALGTVDITSEGARHQMAMRVVVDTHSAAAEIQTIVFQNEYI